MASPNYLFVCGCPRSGTTGFAKLLAASDDVVLGMERYGHRSRPEQFTLTPALFEKERFLTVQEGDTFYDSLDFFARFYEDVAGKIESCRYIGEKRPDLYLSYQRLFTTFPGATVFFLFRDVLEVASSYNVRAREGSWPARKDYRAAVNEWNQSLACTLAALRFGLPVQCVAFNDVFDAASNHRTLFDLLGLAYTEKTAHGVRRVLKEAALMAQRRTLELTPEQSRFVEKKADFDKFRELERVKLRLD